MATTYMTFTTPGLKVATTQAGLSAGTAVECQVQVARIESTQSFTTIPSTGCTGPFQNPGAASFDLQLTYFDDWSASAATSLSAFALANQGKSVWFELTPDKAVVTAKITGNATCVSGGYGGTFGDGSAATSTVTWPLRGVPTVVQPAVAEAEAEEAPAETAA